MNYDKLLSYRNVLNQTKQGWVHVYLNTYYSLRTVIIGRFSFVTVSINNDLDGARNIAQSAIHCWRWIVTFFIKAMWLRNVLARYFFHCLNEPSLSDNECRRVVINGSRFIGPVQGKGLSGLIVWYRDYKYCLLYFYNSLLSKSYLNPIIVCD